LTYDELHENLSPKNVVEYCTRLAAALSGTSL
jgi:hypothetical protein